MPNNQKGEKMMMKLQLYKHYKGSIYEYIGDTKTGIKQIPTSDRSKREYQIHARYTEEPEQLIIIFMIGDSLLSHWPEPLAIYADAEGTVWARPSDMFHGYLEDGRKRFTLLGDTHERTEEANEDR